MKTHIFLLITYLFSLSLSAQNRERLDSFDLSGRAVFRQKEVNDKTLIPINHLSQDVYIVHIQTAEGIMEKKILKK
ncbi:hypothetical protein AGMMS50262_22030 [Bacteroidia bacterium]|nr:hypothetical protein AGMMS50262_22030 [Bacteroidia bacterium]